MQTESDMIVIYCFNKRFDEQGKYNPVQFCLKQKRRLTSICLDFPYIACLLKHKTTEKRDYNLKHISE